MHRSVFRLLASFMTSSVMCMWNKSQTSIKQFLRLVHGHLLHTSLSQSVVPLPSIQPFGNTLTTTTLGNFAPSGRVFCLNITSGFNPIPSAMHESMTVKCFFMAAGIHRDCFLTTGTERVVEGHWRLINIIDLWEIVVVGLLLEQRDGVLLKATLSRPDPVAVLSTHKWSAPASWCDEFGSKWWQLVQHLFD